MLLHHEKPNMYYARNILSIFDIILVYLSYDPSIGTYVPFTFNLISKYVANTP